MSEIERLKSGREWFGFLTLQNVDAVAGRIRSMIGDGQPYTWVACNEGLGNYRPEVRTSQVAAKIRTHHDDEHASVVVVDTYGVWSINTRLSDQDAGVQREPDFSAPYLKITRSQIQIEHKAPVGARLLWTIAVQDMS